jgi:hypothetical protein
MGQLANPEVYQCSLISQPLYTEAHPLVFNRPSNAAHHRSPAGHQALSSFLSPPNRARMSFFPCFPFFFPVRTGTAPRPRVRGRWDGLDGASALARTPAAACAPKASPCSLVDALALLDALHVASSSRDTIMAVRRSRQAVVALTLGRGATYKSYGRRRPSRSCPPWGFLPSLCEAPPPI